MYVILFEGGYIFVWVLMVLWFGFCVNLFSGDCRVGDGIVGIFVVVLL